MAEMKVMVEMKDCGSSEKATPGSKEPTEDWAKVEYQQAQDSAQHHDNLVWTTTSIIWAGNLVLLGLILGLIVKDNNVDTTSQVFSSLRPLFIILGALGILLSLFVWSMQLQFGKIRNFKYKRCKEIEGGIWSEAAHQPPILQGESDMCLRSNQRSIHLCLELGVV